MAAYFKEIHPLVQPILTRLAADESLLDLEVVRFVLHQYSLIEGYDVPISNRLKEVLEVGEVASRITGSMSKQQVFRQITTS